MSLALLVWWDIKRIKQGKTRVAYIRSSNIAFSLKTDTDIVTFDLLIPK